MKTEIFQKFERSEVKAIERLPKKIKQYRNICDFDFVKNSYLILNIRDRDVWSKDCLVPWGAFKEILFNQCPEIIWNSRYEVTQDIVHLYYSNLFSLSKGIYVFNPELAKLLPEIDLESHIPGQALLNLPEWCIYLETSDLNIQNIQPYGIFVVVDYRYQEGFFLKLGIDLEEEIYSLDFPLNSDMTYSMALCDEMSVRQSKEELGYVRSHSEECIDINLDCFFADVIKYTIPRLQYICSQNRNLRNISYPKQAIRRASFLFANKRPFVTQAQNYSEIFVGGDYSGSDFSNQDLSKIVFASDSASNLEAIHPGIKSSAEKTQEEFDSIDFLRQIRNSLEKINGKIQHLNSEVEKLESENKNLLEEGLKYYTELSKSNENADTQKEEYEQVLTEYEMALSQIESLKFSLDKKKDSRLLKSPTKYEVDTTSLLADIVSKIIVGDKDLNPSESLQLVEILYPNRVAILPDAWDSAKKIDHSFQSKSKLTRDLILLVTDYYEKRKTGGDNQARSVFGSRYAAQESDTVMSSSLRKTRIFSGYQMTAHISIGYSERLYFLFENKSQKILIGYCGPHLPISSQ